jgi:UTP--glucose-1-phosphate uridylyltransferase
MSTKGLKRVRKAVFPVAGLGTRALPATKVIPKEMMTVVDRPLIQRAVEEAQEAGIEEFIFVTGRKKSAITEHFEIQPELIEELERKGRKDLLEKTKKSDLMSGTLQTVTQQKAMGLGHAVWCARNLVGDEPFALFLVDVMIMGKQGCTAQMIDAYNQHGGNIIASVDVPRDQTGKYGILDVEDPAAPVSPIRAMVEKPRPENAPSTLSIVGRYILQPEIFDVLEHQERGAGGEIQLTDAMVTLLKSQPFHSMRFKGEHFDCGHHAGLIEANLAYALADPVLGPEMAKILKKYLALQDNNDKRSGTF